MKKSDKSLSEVHGSVDPMKKKGKWRRVAAFLGPAYLVSVGYMDPGNWATDLAGGSQFGYQLLWVLVMSNLMALLLQSLSARLGIVRQLDLAQCNRETYPRAMNFVLYILAELAIAACDLAEVLGMAIGLYLLFDIPILWGVLITFVDTLLLLYMHKLGIRKMEAFIIALIALIGACFLVELFLVRPDPGEMARGLVPEIPDSAALYIAIGIIGATVMPHNLYLHSALVQTRKVEREEGAIRRAIRFNTLDSAIALNLALFVNAAILILAAGAFYTSGNHHVASLEEAHHLLEGILGNQWAPYLFAIALIAAGQSSTITGTLAGQIVMEGYLRLRINPWMRRLITRLIAIVPAVVVIAYFGETMVDEMLIFSQVLLSMQLAFAVIPLIHFVSDRKTMGRFALKPGVAALAWLVAAIIVSLNLKLVYDSAVEWFVLTDSLGIRMLIGAGCLGLVLLLILTTVFPLIRSRKQRHLGIHPPGPADLSGALEPQTPYRKLAMALDFSDRDARVIAQGLRWGGKHAHYVLIHVVESVTARIMDEQAHDHETQEDSRKMEDYVRQLQQKGYEVKGVLGYAYRIEEISRIIKEEEVELLILASHGHGKVSDWIFGETIDALRHRLNIPIFILP